MNVPGPRRPLVALATSREWLQLAPDDGLIAPALQRAGIDATIAVWTDERVDWGRFDLVVVRSCWDYHDDLPRWLDWIDTLDNRGLGDRLCNPPAVLRWNAQKTYLAQLSDGGVPVIPTLWLDLATLASVRRFEEAVATAPWPELVCKPAVSAGALGTFRFSRAQPRATHQALAAAWPALQRRAPFLLQPFQAEIAAEGEWSLLFFDGRLSHAVLKRPAVGDFRVQEKHGGSTTGMAPGRALVAAAERALAVATRAIGCPRPLLYARVDLVNASPTPLLVELELTEPALFLAAGASPAAQAAPADLLARAIRARLTT